MFISANPRTIWQQLTDVLIPLWRAMFHIPHREYLTVYLTRNQLSLTKNIQKIIPTEPLTNDTMSCFADGTFVRLAGSVSIDRNSSAVNLTVLQALADHMLWEMDTHGARMQDFKALFTNKTLKPGRVVLDHITVGLAPQLEFLFPLYQIEVIPETDDMSVIADCLAQVMLFISGHLTTVVYSIFLSSVAAVLEIQPRGLECMELSVGWVRIAETTYAPFEMVKECRCNRSNVPCYFLEDPK
jgi:hypothetical protein